MFFRGVSIRVDCFVFHRPKLGRPRRRVSRAAPSRLNRLCLHSQDQQIGARGTAYQRSILHPEVSRSFSMRPRRELRALHSIGSDRSLRSSTRAQRRKPPGSVWEHSLSSREPRVVDTPYSDRIPAEIRAQSHGVPELPKLFFRDPSKRPRSRADTAKATLG